MGVKRSACLGLLLWGTAGSNVLFEDAVWGGRLLNATLFLMRVLGRSEWEALCMICNRLGL